MFQQQLEQLKYITPISLSEMDAVSLLDRIDSKFVVNKNTLSLLLPCFISDYKILTIDDKNIFSYENNYFDTQDLQFYKDHHNGYVNRIKVRSRKYVESNLCFFEIKKKEKVNRTNKHRERKIALLENLEREAIETIQGFTRKNISEITLSLKNNFNRVTLVNKLHTERVTIDFNLFFSDNTKSKSLEDIMVIEIKQSKASSNSPLHQYLKKLNIREQSFSKYIYGVLALKDNIKKNNFLPILKTINKIYQ